MMHPTNRAEVLAALEENAARIGAFFSGLPDPVFFDGDLDHWSPAHHLVHLGRASRSVERALRSRALPVHPTGRSRTYLEIRDLATSSLSATPADRLLEMGRTAVIEPGTTHEAVVDGFVTASAGLRAAAADWSEEDLHRRAIEHPLMGTLTGYEMLLFFVVHERHHWKSVERRLQSRA
jgi:hypothetical protein